jgi:hypothetical protein
MERDPYVTDGSGCEGLAELLSAHIDGELDPAEEARVLEHLEGCVGCRARFDRLDRTAGLVGMLAEEPAQSPMFAERLEQRLGVELMREGLLASERPWRSGRGDGRSRRVRYALASFGRIAAALFVVSAAAFVVWRWTETFQDRGRGASTAQQIAREQPATSPATRPSPRGEGERSGPVVQPQAVADTPQAGSEAGSPTDGAAPAAAGSTGATAEPTPPGATGTPEGGSEAEAAPPAGTAIAKAGEPTQDDEVLPAPDGAGPPPALSAVERRALAERVRALTAAVAGSRLPVDERVQAAFTLAELSRGPAAEVAEPLAPLAEVLRRPDRYGAQLWQEAARAVGTFPTRAGLALLCEVAETDPVACAAALTRGAEPGLQAWMAGTLLPEVARAGDAAGALALGRALASVGVEAAAPPLAALLQTSRDARLRVELLGVLAAVPGDAARGALTGALEDGEAAVRAAAARGLGGREAPAAVDRLIELLTKDRAPAVRAASALALGAQPGEAPRRALSAARQNDDSFGVRGQALLSLQRLEGVGVFSHLGGAPDPTVPRQVLASRQVAFGLPLEADGLCVLIDTSESMGNAGRLERAVRECDRLLGELAPRTRFTVGVFGEETRFAFGGALAPARADAVTQARVWLGRQGAAHGRTDLAAALRAALSLDGVEQVLVVSDGVPTEGLEGARLVAAVRRANWRGRVRIHTAGVFSATEPFRLDRPELPVAAPLQLLRDLARETGGQFVRN